MSVRLSCITALALACTACGGQPDGLIWKHRSAFTLLPHFFVQNQMDGPVVVGELVVFCGGDGLDREGHVGAVRLADGTPTWKWTVGMCKDGPIIINDSIAVGWGSQPDHLRMVGVRISRGIKLWDRAFPRDVQYQRLVGFGDDVYLGHEDMLYRISAARGRQDHFLVNECPKKSPHKSWMATDGKRLLFGCGAKVFDVTNRGENTQLLFELSEPLRYPEQFTFDDSVMYVADRKSPFKMTAVDLANGRIQWSRQLPGVHDAPAIVGDTAYFPSAYTLMAVNKHTGRDIWSTHTRNFYRPLFIDDALFTVDHRSVVKLDPRTGNVIKRYSARGEVAGTPVAVGDMMLYGDLMGYLYLVRRN